MGNHVLFLLDVLAKIWYHQVCKCSVQYIGVSSKADNVCKVYGYYNHQNSNAFTVNQIQLLTL